MDVDGQTQKPRLSKNSNRTDLMDVTILSTPRPQASSTVERRTFGYRVGDLPSDNYKRLYASPTGKLENSRNNTDDSLGILENLPSFSTDNGSFTENNKSKIGAVSDERELARRLLQRCSGIQMSNFVPDTDKENNANSPNLSGERTPSTLLDSGQSFNLTPFVAKEQSPLRKSSDKISTASLNFEPNEITARSSAMNKSLEAKDAQLSNESTSGISFGPGNADLMAQYENEDFQSGSKMSSQLLEDEISFQQNGPYALPLATSTEKEHLELSCFSGIIGDLNLTVESCAGRKLSAGEFFQRKCGNVGNLSGVFDPSKRPSFGNTVTSPKRTKNMPLVDVTTMTEDSSHDDQKSERILGSFSETTKEHTLMSLSTIAQTLKDIDNGTPRRLVDQLLMAKKQKKKPSSSQEQNLTSGTYTLPMPNCRNSMPLYSTKDNKNFEKESILLGQTAKLSLDSKNYSTAYGKVTQSSIVSDRSIVSTVDYQNDDTIEKIRRETLAERTLNVTSSILEKQEVEDYSTIKQALDESLENRLKMEGFSKSKESHVELKKHRNTGSSRNVDQFKIKKEEISAQRSALEATVTINTSNDRICANEGVEIGKSTQELQHCIVGVRREIDIELINRSHRWIICSPTLNQVQGERDNVEFEIVPKMMLIPDTCRNIKVGAKVLKPGKPILVALNAEMSEMTTRSTWQMQHMMWLIPEDVKIVITAPTGKDEFQFQSSMEKPSDAQFVTLENKNSIDVELKLSIVNDDGHRFRLECHEDYAISDGIHNDNSMCLGLKTSEQFKVVVRYNGTPDIDRKKKESTNYTAKLLLSICDREYDVIIKEVPLLGCAGTIAKSNPVTVDRTSDHFRCDTPQHFGIISSPTSPHSTSNRSGISGRNSPLSSASGGTVAGDVISIRATHAALVWNSIKVGKSDTKEFTIRNTSNNKIKLQATIVDNDNCFKFLRERQQVATHMVLGLQRMESRSFSVVFGPNSAGAAAGRIVFKHYEPKRESTESRPSKVIFLYGYGGLAKVEITEAFKDTGGQLWLSLGSLNAGGTLDAKIKLQNTGDLCSYAKVRLTPKAVYPAMVSSWSVNPTELLLGPKEVRWVTLEFRPRKEDLALLKRANVSHVGTLTITHGDEPTRLRIRRLYKKMSQNGQMSGKENEPFRNVVYPICKVFPGETQINNLNIIRDSVENLGDLCRGVRQHEVMLTMEVNAEESMSILHDNADDSQMFYSLCSDNSHVFPSTEESFMPSETLMECTGDQRIYEEDFTVSPSMITLRPPAINEATVMMMSSSNVAQPFETVLSNSEYLSVVPAEGMIPTRRGFPLRVHCKKRFERNIDAVLQVYTANDRRDVQIRVLIS